MSDLARPQRPNDAERDLIGPTSVRTGVRVGNSSFQALLAHCGTRTA